MKERLFLGKKAVSEVVGYVLLVVIAIGLSVVVYAYLRGIIPSEPPQCPDDISLSISDVSCIQTYPSPLRGELNITITNRGLFTVSGATVSLIKEGRKTGKKLNDDASLYFIMPGSSTTGLKPQNSINQTYTIDPSRDYIGTGNYSLEIQPAVVNEDGKIVYCKSIIRPKIVCVL